MTKELIKNINEIVKDFLKDDRFETIDDLEEMWHKLYDIFNDWENKIEKERTKDYVTDDVENKFKGFAELCTRYIVISIKKLNLKKERVIQFFKHRHASYGFYILYEKINSEEDEALVNGLKKIIQDTEYSKILYCSLVEYFSKFYGRFYDNEMAIRMLCHYYSDELKLNEEEQNQLVNALYRHITNAGEPGDLGYAYAGIARITEGVGNLSTAIIEKVLKMYGIHFIINDKIYRKQIYTIIRYSKLKEKEKYKFFFIDSIWIADAFSRIIFSKYKNGNEELIARRWNYEVCTESELLIFERKNSNYKCFWIYNNYTSRALKLEDKIIAQIYLEQDICIKYKDENMNIKFEYSDWMLNQYDTDKFDNELEQLINKSDANVDEIMEIDINIDNTKQPESEITDTNEQKFLFSYIYLNNYRGIDNHHLSFDHKYYFDTEKWTINLNASSDLEIDNFYSKNIYSLSCIVGKNGTGKTSILDFLRKFFFTMIDLIDRDRLKFEGNIVRVQKSSIFEDINDKTEFVVIFTYNKKCYILTNMEKVQYDTNQILPYYPGLLAKRNDNSKIIYFSNMIDVNDSRLFDVGKHRKINNIDVTENDIKEDELKALKGFRIADYSENISYIKRQSYIMQSMERDGGYETNYNLSKEQVPNIDFIYQMVFLDAHNTEDLIKWFGDKFHKNNLHCNKIEKGGKQEEIFRGYFQGGLNEILIKESKKLDRNKNKDIEEENHENQCKFKDLACSSESKIEYFSSGQYAKFSFLSKLYWCLKGYDEYHKNLEKVFGPNIFHVQNTLQENDTAIIFIDEGELYYHPEWQRTYICTLNDFLKDVNKNIHLQIVMTTNSPFIISDIQKKDITYLTTANNKAGILTFGQNIHTLLKSNFFMDYTIGEFARQQINFIIEQIKIQENEYKNDKDIEDKAKYVQPKYKSKAKIADEFNKRFNTFNVSEKNIYGYMKSIIELIGEDIYRLKLLSMLDECMQGNELSELERLEDEKLRIEEKIRNLKRCNNDSSKKL